MRSGPLPRWAVGLVALTVAGCQPPSGQTTTAEPTPNQGRAGRTHHHDPDPPVDSAHPGARQPHAQPQPAPRRDAVVGVWPVRTLEQARELQDAVDVGHQPWMLSPETVSTVYAGAELGLLNPKVQQVAPAAYLVPRPQSRAPEPS